MVELCDRCEAIFYYVREIFAQPALAYCCGFRFGDYQALQQNAENSTCRLCRIVFSSRRQDEIQRIIGGGHLDELDCSFDFFDETQELLCMDVYTPSHRVAKIFGSKLRFRRCERNTADVSAFERSTWSWRSLDLVRGWFRACSSLHKACSTSSAAGRLPLRFLDIDPENKIPQLRYELDKSSNIDLLSLEHMPKVKLCLTASLASRSQYVTLSHCWGRSPVTKLMNGNLEQYSQSIPSDVLESPTAATFRQAIHVARCLGFRYLWIDALCINQEDDSEKEEEISYMDQIYTHATLNLSATAAQDGSGGLFFGRVPESVDVCQSQQYPGIVAFLEPSHAFVKEVVKSPINQRAWVFQERMLATRVLHFCRSRLFWECCSLQKAEPLSEGIPTSIIVPPGQTKQLVLPHQRELLKVERARLRWANAIENYSRTSLSFRRDTLLAVSAIAATLCRQRGLQPRDYAAGLWVADLPLSLRWRVACQPDRAAAEYVAPSWSWAALFCAIDVQRDTYVRVFADRFDPSIHLKRDSAPFGSVIGGSLRLRGMLISLNYLESEDCFHMGVSGNQAPTVVSSGFPGTIRDGLPDKVYRWSKQGQVSRFVQQSSQSHDLPFDESDVLICEWDNGIPGQPQTPRAIRFHLSGGSSLEIQDGSFILLPLGQRKRDSSDNENGGEESESDDRRGLFDRIEGLILHRTLAKGEYVRVGLFYYTLQHAINQDEEMFGWVSGRDEYLEASSYLQKHNNNGQALYTIRII